MRRPSVPMSALLCLVVSYLYPSVCHAKAATYQYCLYECSNCVIFWGDDLYDGKKCATCCQYSNGLKTDPECKVWVKNRTQYSKKDLDYVTGILGTQKRTQKRWSNLNYGTIFGQDETPDYCFGTK